MSARCVTPDDCLRGEPCMFAAGCGNDPRLADDVDWLLRLADGLPLPSEAERLRKIARRLATTLPQPRRRRVSAR